MGSQAGKTMAILRSGDWSFEMRYAGWSLGWLNYRV
jgi:hypothetical protein